GQWSGRPGAGEQGRGPWNGRRWDGQPPQPGVDGGRNRWRGNDAARPQPQPGTGQPRMERPQRNWGAGNAPRADRPQRSWGGGRERGSRARPD
ncbi:MAG: peptidase, partial [Sphingobium sp.]